MLSAPVDTKQGLDEGIQNICFIQRAFSLYIRHLHKLCRFTFKPKKNLGKFTIMLPRLFIYFPPSCLRIPENDRSRSVMRIPTYGE